MANQPKQTSLIQGRSTTNQMGSLGQWGGLTAQQKAAMSLKPPAPQAPPVQPSQPATTQPAPSGLSGVQGAPGVGRAPTQAPPQPQGQMNPADAALKAAGGDINVAKEYTLAQAIAGQRGMTQQPISAVPAPIPGRAPLAAAAGVRPTLAPTPTVPNERVDPNAPVFNPGTIAPQTESPGSVAGVTPGTDMTPGSAGPQAGGPTTQEQVLQDLVSQQPGQPDPGTVPLPQPGGDKSVPPINIPDAGGNTTQPGPAGTQSQDWLNALQGLVSQIPGQDYYNQQRAAGMANVESQAGQQQLALDRAMAARGMGSSGQYMTGANALNAAALGQMGAVEADIAKQQTADRLAATQQAAGIMGQGLQGAQTETGLQLQGQDLANAEQAMRFNMLSNLMESELKDTTIMEKLGLPESWSNMDALQWLLSGGLSGTPNSNDPVYGLTATYNTK